MAGTAATTEGASGFARPYVVSWNLTYRCNLACEHCYLDAGGAARVTTENFSDRSELSTEECFAVADQIAAFAPEALTILTGGEPLLRRDILEIIRHAASKELWVVVGTNGVKITANVAHHLREAGARGLSLSLDALDPARHDAFRAVRGAWENTVRGAGILNDAGLPFIVQTTVGAHNRGELEAIAAFAHEKLSARVWNLYFLVPTGRGQFVSDIAPEEYDGVLATLARLQRDYAGKMIVNAKCAPHFIKTVLAEAEAGRPAPYARAYSGGAGGCPAGTHYLGIRPNGDVTPCPYLPQFGGNLKVTTLGDVWASSDLFRRVRERTTLGGRCGDCELQSQCGGCRARAYGVTGDLMAEDPLCTHQPGRFVGSPLLAAPKAEYGLPVSPAATAATAPAEPATAACPVSIPSEAAPLPASTKVAWDDDAAERMKRIPAFVRGMVTRAVEDSCRKQGIARVTLDQLEKIRARMPTPKFFGGGPRPQ